MVVYDQRSFRIDRNDRSTWAEAIEHGKAQGIPEDELEFLQILDLEMAEFTMEVCDGRPSYVEAHTDEFVDQVGRYCPWAAQLVEVKEQRG